jgi:hypothetical protein
MASFLPEDGFEEGLWRGLASSYWSHRRICLSLSRQAKAAGTLKSICLLVMSNLLTPWPSLMVGEPRL